MTNLVNLKERLLALPAVRKGRKHQERYAAYLDKTRDVKAKLEKTVAFIANTSSILPSKDCGEALRSTRRAVSAALRLHETLASNPESVLENAVEKRFIALFEHVNSAWKYCQEGWEKEIDAKIRNWTSLAEVVGKLVPGEGTRLRITIASLQSAKASPPKTKTEAINAQRLLEDLKGSVTRLGLDTAFGKFLQAAASPEGADLDAAQVTDVQETIAKYELEKVFRVRLLP